MLDLSKFTTEQLEEMLETREKLLYTMTTITNLPEIVQEIEDIKNFLGKNEELSDVKYGKA